MTEESTDEPAQAPPEQAESGESGAAESAPEGPSEPAPEESDDQPEIESEEQAIVPDDINPDDIEAEAGSSDDTDDDQDDAGDAVEDGADSMAPDQDSTTDPTTAGAGEMYVSVVRSATNAQIRKHGGDELGRDHFEQYDLSDHFDRTMDQMGVGSDLEPHEALLMATVLSMGDGLVRETNVLDQQIDRLMNKAMGGQEASS